MFIFDVTSSTIQEVESNRVLFQRYGLVEMIKVPNILSCHVAMTSPLPTGEIPVRNPCELDQREGPLADREAREETAEGQRQEELPLPDG